MKQERARIARWLKRTAARRFVFLDESGVRVGMKQTHGHSALGYRIVMDNLAVHKVKGVEEAIRSAGAKPLYLPPYSPDLKPIEIWLGPR